MSLLLRKQCQAHLNAIGLTSFHVSISTEKRLVIQTLCGKPFITVWGISFNRSSPTNAEIEYASELFETFLVRHQVQIEDYIEAYDKFHSKPVVHSITDGFSVSCYRDQDFIEFRSEPFWAKIAVTKKTQETTLKVWANDYEKLSAYIGKSIKETDCDAALAHYATYIMYDKERDALTQLESDLSSCDI